MLVVELLLLLDHYIRVVLYRPAYASVSID